MLSPARVLASPASSSGSFISQLLSSMARTGLSRLVNVKPGVTLLKNSQLDWFLVSVLRLGAAIEWPALELPPVLHKLPSAESLLSRRMPSTLRLPTVSFVHSWQRRRGWFLLIRSAPLNCFAGGGLARQIESTRDSSSTLMHPGWYLDKKPTEASGFEVSLVLYIMPRWMLPMTWKRVPDPSSWVSTKIV